MWSLRPARRRAAKPSDVSPELYAGGGRYSNPFMTRKGSVDEGEAEGEGVQTFIVEDGEQKQGQSSWRYLISACLLAE